MDGLHSNISRFIKQENLNDRCLEPSEIVSSLTFHEENFAAPARQKRSENQDFHRVYYELPETLDDIEEPRHKDFKMRTRCFKMISYDAKEKVWRARVAVC